jgi:hypothetical protein
MKLNRKIATLFMLALVTYIAAFTVTGRINQPMQNP